MGGRISKRFDAGQPLGGRGDLIGAAGTAGEISCFDLVGTEMGVAMDEMSLATLTGWSVGVG